KNENGVWEWAELADTDARITSFGVDEVGNIYMLDYNNRIFMLSDPSMMTVNSQIFLPIANRDSANAGPGEGIPTPTPVPGNGELEWDPRLDQRTVQLTTAQPSPGQGYWKLIKGVWYDVTESEGRHHIFVDTLDPNSARQSDVPVLISWPDGNSTINTQLKPGEEYAADYGMFSVGYEYSARPDDGAPADTVSRLGMGT
ncbi:MAG: hypothetical protein KDE50_30190, partial [Caldilineaceae bacterium]|nr:hypothetical protein [Caldilineaceae bacterium]